MIRFLLIVLMFALPAQFVWAAAAGYCAHESDPVTFHIGHHLHEHRVSSSDAEEPETGKRPVTPAHTDCSYCHAVVAQFAPPQPSTTGPPPRHIFESSDSDVLGTGAENNIERPKWTCAA